MPSLAAETRDAVRRNPFLLSALRAGVVNYTAAARFLDVDGDPEAVATALRRFAAELPTYETRGEDARVTMQSGLGEVPARSPDADDPLLRVGDAALVAGAGSLTGVIATGDVDARGLGAVLSRLEAESVDVVAAAVAGGALLVVVDRRDGAGTIRVVEAALTAIPAPE